MAQFDLNRAQDVPIATLKLNEITPQDWHRYPPRVADMTPEHVPVLTYTGGRPNSAPYTPVEHGTANSTDDYSPRTQADKAATLGVPFAVPINTPFGSIEPRDPYPKAGDPAPAAPVITSLTPNTAEVGEPAFMVKVTGTGFTPFSVIEVGGTNYAPTTFISPTELRFPVDTENSVAGTIDVKVLDHNIKSAASPFTFT